MLETGTLCLFAAGLVVCLLLKGSILIALLFGFVLFFAYGLAKGHGAGALMRMALQGVKSVKNILLTFLLIGMITAVWRACGAIAYIIGNTASLVPPSVFLLAEFLLCSLISFLTGTAFGAAATAGTICMTLANLMGVSPLLSGGAILSGVFFGDRCSPMSTSALLVCELTRTDIYRNIRLMARTSAFPFALTCAAYLLLGLGRGGAAADTGEVWALFETGFRLHWTAAIPAALIVALALLRFPVRRAMAVSIAAGCAVCLLLQKTPPLELVRLLVHGFHAENPELGAMMNGGGVFSMLTVSAIIFISSSYAGLFDGTGLLRGLKGSLETLSRRITPYGATLVTAALTCMASCNQTLATLLTYQLCRDAEPDPQRMAINLENTVIVVAPMIPWSIASITPLTSVNAPMASILTAFYLFLVPLWNLFFQPDRRKA